MADPCAQIPITFASYQRCSRTLVKGELKRVMQRGPLVGYYIACPACGFAQSYLDDEVHYVEQPVEIDGLVYMHATGMRDPGVCLSCNRRIVIADGFVSAYEG